MRLSLGEWLDIPIYLPFPASIVFQTSMKRENDNPMFMESWLPKQYLVGSLGVNYIEDGGR